MKSLEHFIDQKLIQGRSFFSKESALASLDLTPVAFTAAAERLIKKGRLVSPWRGFFLILRPEDRNFGAPDPARWIEPLMNHLKLDYRISLLRAAAFHGSTHQASMVFQVVAPRQLRDFELGRHRLEFVFLNPKLFENTNKALWLDQMKTDSGYAKVAGEELTLLDSVRYYHKAGGLNAVAQMVYDFGEKVDKQKLAAAAAYFENSSVRRLGYLLEHFGYSKQAQILEPLARKAKSLKPLDPSVTPLEGVTDLPELNPKWMLSLNTQVEIDL